MKRVWFSLFVVILIAPGLTAHAQPGATEFQDRWIAHGFFAAGSSLAENNAGFIGGGGGVEAFIWKRVTAGADASGFRDNYYRAVGTFGHVGAQVGYHFASREKTRGVDPFILFGVGSFFPKESRPAVHGGAGLTYWFQRHIGARAEFRVGERPYGDNIDGVFRVGIAFR